jgi:nucleotide-binding universal stress UspA family protein
VNTVANIVVGIDGSADADAALRWAVREAWLRHTTVTAVLAWSPDDCPAAVEERAGTPGVPGVERAAWQVLRDAARRARDARRPVAVFERAVYRDAVDALLDAAGQADMLVVGHHGSGRLRRFLMGSVSAACLHSARGPVVVVRRDAAPDIPDDGRGVLVGVDGSPASISALRWAAGEAALRAVPLTVAHAWLPVPPVYAGYYTGTDAAAMERAARAILDDCLDQGLAGGADVAVDARLVLGGAAQGLMVMAAEAQLLVVGSRGHGGFSGLLLGSTSHQCVHHAPCPVAVLRAPDG